MISNEIDCTSALTLVREGHVSALILLRERHVGARVLARRSLNFYLLYMDVSVSFF